MAHLADTNILLRWVQLNDPDHALAQAAVTALHRRGEVVFVTAQNTHLLTLDTTDFRRYPGIIVVHPRDATGTP